MTDGERPVIRQAGRHALLVETGTLEVSHRLDALLRADRPSEVVEIVPGPATVLVVAPGADLGALRTHLSTLLGTAARDGREGTTTDTGEPVAPGGREDVVTIPVVWDGADLPDVAEITGLPVEEIVDRFCRVELVVGWLGFAPGFAYLTGLDPLLHVPRLATPRTSVPAGAVAVAGPYAAIYPSASPGGWRLLGHTTTTVWDVDADPPSMLRPGMRVRFEAIT
jgi:KipI family sensor histidine kinase inhibitor